MAIDKNQRIGTLQEVRQHPWFAGFDWDSLLNKTMEPLFIPNQNIENNFDKKNVNEHQYKDEDELKKFDRDLKKLDYQRDNFGDYYYEKVLHKEQ